MYNGCVFGFANLIFAIDTVDYKSIFFQVPEWPTTISISCQRRKSKYKLIICSKCCCKLAYALGSSPDFASNINWSELITYYFPWNHQRIIPANMYLFKINIRNTGKRCEIRRSDVFIIFEHISHLFLVFLLLTLNK